MTLEDLYPAGEKIELGSRTFTAEDIIRFASLYDPQPFHVDPEAAKHSLFGGLCASGWHTCAAWMRCFVDHYSGEVARLTSEGIAPPKVGPSPGFRNLQWLRPVFAGDTIRFFATLTGSRTLATRPGWRLVSMVNEGVNQHDETVMRFDGSVLEFE
ncbi:MaoC family dehydratase [Rhizobium sp. RAF56]|jgi:acyl dehydratase|uniref:MaoC family dehydratase n=1 Tax=Rhizobium sp. RAF56 TaxID=3233062 RepID=UPI003F9B068B